MLAELATSSAETMRMTGRQKVSVSICMDSGPDQMQYHA